MFFERINSSVIDFDVLMRFYTQGECDVVYAPLFRLKQLGLCAYL